VNTGTVPAQSNIAAQAGKRTEFDVEIWHRAMYSQPAKNAVKHEFGGCGAMHG
jgi:hypothetical protein